MEADVDEPVFPFTYALWPRRLASAVIDALVVGLLSVPFVAPFIDSSGERVVLSPGEYRTALIVGILLQVTYFTGMHAWRGATVGKIAARTVLLRDDGRPVTPGVAFVRAVSLVGINAVSGFLLFVPGIVNMLSPLWHPRRQTFHDRLAKTIVVLRETA